MMISFAQSFSNLIFQRIWAIEMARQKNESLSLMSDIDFQNQHTDGVISIAS
jgi:hypothetical protein